MKEDKIIIEKEAKKELEKGKKEAEKLLNEPEKLELFLQNLKKIEGCSKVRRNISNCSKYDFFDTKLCKKIYTDIRYENLDDRVCFLKQRENLHECGDTYENKCLFFYYLKGGDMKEIIEKENLRIEDMIYEVRGVEIMLDCDITNLYHVDTKRINEVVKNNPDKFPERFSFVLLDSEYDDLRSKFSTAKISSKSRYNPWFFTEQG